MAYNTIIPYLNIRDADKAIEFYKRAFGAREVGRIIMPDGTVGHAEIEIGDSRIWIAEENEQWGNPGPITLGDSPVCLCIYVEDVDTFFDTALREGATVTGNMEVKDVIYGERSGSLTDPFGHKWSVMSHIEDVSFEEMQKRSDEIFSGIKK